MTNFTDPRLREILRRLPMVKGPVRRHASTVPRSADAAGSTTDRRQADPYARNEATSRGPPAPEPQRPFSWNAPRLLSIQGWTKYRFRGISQQHPCPFENRTRRTENDGEFFIQMVWNCPYCTHVNPACPAKTAD